MGERVGGGDWCDGLAEEADDGKLEGLAVSSAAVPPPVSGEESPARHILDGTSSSVRTRAGGAVPHVSGQLTMLLLRWQHKVWQ